MQYVKDYLHSVVVVFTAYDLIDEQLRSGNIYTISYNQLQNHVNAYLEIMQLLHCSGVSV